jgi:hypothetical protein
MKRTRATGTPTDACPALPEDPAPALEAYLRACGVSSLLLVSISPGLVHLEDWQDIPRALAALADHPAVAEVADGPLTGNSICWSLRPCGQAS